ncbi:MAG TPA: prepilin-type N-terminal cleavage/methylation domain-containing protein [Hyphomicrobiaceae bacterium]|nr:prepilin-type N-terminal cleavage/methylation domain-containing protein [Hyphomicrobiaceae bacterium]
MSVQSPRRPTPAQRQSGFTLIEVLVSLVLLALVLTLLTGGVRYARGTWNATARLDDLVDSDVAGAFIRARLAEAMPIYEQRKEGVMQVLFQGAADSVGFVAPAPNGPGGAGLYRYSLEAEAEDEGAPRSLVVKVAAFFAGQTELRPALPADRHVLMRNVRSVSFRYFGRSEIRDPPAWHDAWTRLDAMPRLVEIAIARNDSDGGPVNLVVPLRLQAGAR